LMKIPATCVGGLIGGVAGIALGASSIPGIPVPSGEMSYPLLGILIGLGIGYYVDKSHKDNEARIEPTETPGSN